MLRAALEGLADLPVRCWQFGTAAVAPAARPGNARWSSGSPTPHHAHCDVVVCHAGHGTVARALASGCAVVAVPSAGE